MDHTDKNKHPVIYVTKVGGVVSITDQNSSVRVALYLTVLLFCTTTGNGSIDNALQHF